MDIGYKIVRALLAAPFFSHYHISIKGKENLLKPNTQELIKPAVVTVNHITYLDPLFTIASLDKEDPVHFLTMSMSKREDRGFFDWIYDRLYDLTGQIIIGKGGWREYYRKAREVLGNGRYLGIFPEGRRSKTGELLDFKDGAASIAIRAKVPLIPVYISGAYDNGKIIPLPFRRVEVRIGKPVMPNPNNKGRKAAVDLTQRVKEEIERLGNY